MPERNRLCGPCAMEAPWNKNASTSAIDSKGDRQRQREARIDLTPVSRPMNTLMFVVSATASSSRSNDDAMSVYITEEERQRNRCRPAATLRADGDCGQSLRHSSSSMPLTSPSPRSLTLPPKPHQQTSWYSWDETLPVNSTKFKSRMFQMSSIARDTMISSPLEQEEDDKL